MFKFILLNIAPLSLVGLWYTPKSLLVTFRFSGKLHVRTVSWNISTGGTAHVMLPSENA